MKDLREKGRFRDTGKMETWFLFLSALGLAVVFGSGCNSAPGRPGLHSEVVPPGKILDGALLYQQNCAGCHGTEGKDGAAIGVGDPIYLAIASDATIRRVVAGGVPGTAMPAFARSFGGMLTDEQIDSVVGSIRGRWGKPDVLHGDVPPSYSASAAGEANRGSTVYKTYCSACHGATGQRGKRAGSILDGSYLTLVSDQNLRTLIIVGRPERGAPDWRADLPGKPMSEQDVSDVVAWLGTQRPSMTSIRGQTISRAHAAAGGSR